MTVAGLPTETTQAVASQPPLLPAAIPSSDGPSTDAPRSRTGGFLDQLLALVEGFEEVMDQAAEAGQSCGKRRQPSAGDDSNEEGSITVLPGELPAPAEQSPVADAAGTTDSVPPDEDQPGEEVDPETEAVPFIGVAVDLPVAPIDHATSQTNEVSPTDLSGEAPAETTARTLAVNDAGLRDEVSADASESSRRASRSSDIVLSSDSDQNAGRASVSTPEGERISAMRQAATSAPVGGTDSSDQQLSEGRQSTTAASKQASASSTREPTTAIKDQADLGQARVVPPGQTDSKSAGDLSFAARVVADERLATSQPVAYTAAQESQRPAEATGLNIARSAVQAPKTLGSDQQAPAEETTSSESAELKRAIGTGSESSISEHDVEGRTLEQVGQKQTEVTNDKLQNLRSLTATVGASPEASATGSERARESETVRPPSPPMPPDLNTSTAQSARRVHLRLEGSDASRVDVRVMERGGKLDVAVRTPEPELASLLRSELGGLMSQMQGQGMRATAWVPEDRLSTGSQQPGLESFQNTDGGSGTGSDQKGSDQQSQRDPQQRPQWLQQLDDETDPEVSFSEEVIDWLRVSAR